MNRRKKSALFSATLAGVGLVAGSVIALTSNTHAAEEVNFDGMSVEDISEVISKKAEMSADSVSESLQTKTIIVDVPDVSVLENDPTIVKFERTLAGKYIVEYKTVEDTAKGYEVISNADDSSAILNFKLKSNRFKFTGDKEGAQAWGVKTMKMDVYADSLESKTNKVTVAVLDSGINKDHEVFSESSQYDRLDFTYAYDYVNDDNDPADDNFHGTMVAGTVAESTPKNVKIIPIKVLDDEGSGDFSWLFSALSDIAGKVDIINMSLGIEQKDLTATQMQYIDAEMAAAKAKGSILVAAAGNESADSIDYPAAAPACISATSVNSSNQFSSSFSNHGVRADFATPGEDLILPAYDDNENYYIHIDGTSFSSPFLAAAIANIKMEYPSAAQGEIYDHLKLNAEDLGDAGWDEYYGWGSVSFHVNKYADLKINSVTVPTEWTNEDVTVTVNASSSAYDIQKNVLGEGTIVTTPTTWTNITTAGKTIAEKKTISKNGTYTIWLKNSNNETAYKTFTVNKIDKTKPALTTNIKASDITEDSVTLSVSVNENESGLDKIDWYYKKSSDSKYTKVSDTISSSSLSAMAVTKTHKLSDLEGGEYTAYAEIFDKAGNKVTSATITFTVEADGEEVGGDPVVPETPTDPTPSEPGNPEKPEGDTPKPVDGGVANPKTDSQSILPVSIAGGAFLLAGAFVAIRRRR